MTESEKQKDAILVIDDQPNNLKVIAGVLGAEYSLSLANGGLAALRMLEKIKPDLILLDVMMPEMDGFETCKAIKSTAATKDIPVIFLTAKSDIDDISKGFECGAVDYITKPFNPIEVKARVKTHIGLFRSKEQLAKMNLQLIEAEEELKNMLGISRNQNERLKSFAYIVSHNLRSHSRNIDSLIHYLEEEHEELGKIELFQLLQKASGNLLETIGNLSEVAGLAAGEKKEFRVINLSESISNAITNVSALALASGVEIINETEENLQVLGIPAYIDSIILNFLTNAIKYSDKQKQSFVRISTRSDGQMQLLCIEDNGLGIDLVKYGKQLFGMYKTFHNHSDSRGFGLFITKNQIEAIGGRVEVESEPGLGTRFMIYLQPEKRFDHLVQTFTD